MTPETSDADGVRTVDLPEWMGDVLEVAQSADGRALLIVCQSGVCKIDGPSATYDFYPPPPTSGLLN